MTDAIVITKDQLREVLEVWEHAFRDGETIHPSEAATLPVDQVARQNADYLWELLGGHAQ